MNRQTFRTVCSTDSKRDLRSRSAAYIFQHGQSGSPRLISCLTTEIYVLMNHILQLPVLDHDRPRQPHRLLFRPNSLATGNSVIWLLVAEVPGFHARSQSKTLEMVYKSLGNILAVPFARRLATFAATALNMMNLELTMVHTACDATSATLRVHPHGY
jgi:hypothetical protein